MTLIYKDGNKRTSLERLACSHPIPMVIVPDGFLSEKLTIAASHEAQQPFIVLFLLIIAILSTKIAKFATDLQKQPRCLKWFMTTKNNIYKSYSMEYGTFVGLTWGGVFLTYVEGISYNNGLLMLLCFMLCGVAMVLPFVLGWRLNKKMALAGEQLSYFQGLFFAFSMFMYACLMDGLIVFAYFQFLDDGLLMEQLNAILMQPEMVKTYQQMGMGEQHAQMMDILAEADGLSAWEKTLLIFNNNFFFSTILSFIVAGVASYDIKKINKKSYQQ